MKKIPIFPIEFLTYVNMIDGTEFEGVNWRKCLNLLKEHEDRFIKAPGSKTKHQAWPGGYIDHLIETMQFAVKLYALMTEERPLPFTLSDAILVLFFHDIEKPFKYIPSEYVLDTEEQKWDFLMKIITTYNVQLTEDHINALKYIHGEGKDYNRTERIMNELAQFCHMCDGTSARIWYDYPKK